MSADKQLEAGRIGSSIYAVGRDKAGVTHVAMTSADDRSAVSEFMSEAFGENVVALDDVFAEREDVSSPIAVTPVLRTAEGVAIARQTQLEADTMFSVNQDLNTFMQRELSGAIARGGDNGVDFTPAQFQQFGSLVKRLQFQETRLSDKFQSASSELGRLTSLLNNTSLPESARRQYTEQADALNDMLTTLNPTTQLNTLAQEIATASKGALNISDFTEATPTGLSNMFGIDQGTAGALLNAGEELPLDSPWSYVDSGVSGFGLYSAVDSGLVSPTEVQWVVKAFDRFTYRTRPESEPGVPEDSRALLRHKTAIQPMFDSAFMAIKSGRSAWGVQGILDTVGEKMDAEGLSPREAHSFLGSVGRAMRDDRVALSDVQAVLEEMPYSIRGASASRTDMKVLTGIMTSAAEVHNSAKATLLVNMSDGFVDTPSGVTLAQDARQAIECYHTYGVWPNDALLCRQLFDLHEVYPFVTEVRAERSTTTD